MAKLLSIKLGPFHVYDTRHMWPCVLMGQNHTFREQFLSFVLDGFEQALECPTAHIGGNGSSMFEEFNKKWTLDVVKDGEHHFAC